MNGILRTALVLVASAALAVSADDAPSTRRLSNLEKAAEVWSRLYFFHPLIVTEGIDWEKAMVEAIPAIEAAKNDDELVRALDRTLLSRIDDGEIRVFADASEPEHPRAKAVASRKLAPGTGLIEVRDPDLTADPKFLERFAAAWRELGPVERLIVDLRWPGRQPSPDAVPNAILRFFVRGATLQGGTVQRQHTGWSERQDPNVYRQNWIVNGGTALTPITERALFDRSFADTDLAALPIISTPVLFLINNASHFALSYALDTLQREGPVAVVWERRGATPRPRFVSTVAVGDYGLHLPDAMLLNRSGGLGFRADRVVEAIAEDDLVRLASQLLPPQRGSGVAFDFRMKFPPLPALSDEISREQRIAGLIKIWAVVNRFDPHLEFASPAWSRLLRDGIPAVEGARDAQAYFTELRRLTASLNDNHVTIGHRSLAGGRAIVPVEFRSVEGHVLLSRVGQGVNADLKPADELIAVDGRAVREIEEEERPRTSLSTPATLARNLWTWGIAFRGKTDTPVRLTLERAGKRHEVTLQRVENPIFPPHSAAFRRLEGGLGYINLCELANVADLDRALSELSGARALVLDLRDYPKFWITRELTARLVKVPVLSTKFVVPIVTSADETTETWTTSQYRVEPHPTVQYGGPVAVLMNENTQSMAEDLCIYLRNAKRAKFVGSQTAGTNGNVTTISLPGGGRMTFTGMRVLYGDGSRFQNIGIVPDFEVRPTVAGVRAGRDEVLEKAIAVLENH
jgi:C-terminal processing protease CtpA/Prc